MRWLMLLLTAGCERSADTATAETDGPTDTDPESAVSLTFIDEWQVDDAVIWNGISHDDDVVRFTTMFDQHLRLHRWSHDLAPIGEPVQLTFDEDVPEGEWIADHAQLWRDDHLFLAWSTHDARDLFLMKVDGDGNRIGDIAAVALDSDLLTNDMHLASDGADIVVWWGDAGFDHALRRYDFDLSPLGDAEPITPPVELPQLGSTVFHDGSVLQFTGDGPQRNLMMSRWSAGFEPQSPFQQVLIPTVDQDWNWFCSGSIYDAVRGVWFVAYNHMAADESADEDATIEIAAFDSEFELQQRFTATAPGTTRPHLDVIGDQLVLTYDGAGVFVQRYGIGP